MKTNEEIMETLHEEIKLARRAWDYVFTYDTPEREKERAMDRLTTLNVLYRKITGKSYEST